MPDSTDGRFTRSSKRCIQDKFDLKIYKLETDPDHQISEMDKYYSQFRDERNSQFPFKRPVFFAEI